MRSKKTGALSAHPPLPSDYESESLTVFNFPDYYIIPEPFIVCVSNLFCYCHILRQYLGGDTTDIVLLKEEL